MIHALQWLLGLQRIRLTDGRIALRFATPPAPWLMLAGAVLAAVAIYLVYRRERIQRRWRWTLFTLRLSAVMIVLFLIGQPMIVLRRNQVDPSRVAVLLDRSQSMAVHDVVLAGPGQTTTQPAVQPTRWDSAIDLLIHPDRGLLACLAPRHHVGLWTFADSTSREGDATDPGDAQAVKTRLSEMSPVGTQTDLGGAVAHVLEVMQGSPLAAIVVASDGRQTRTERLDAALSQAQARSIPIHVLATGSQKPLRDLSIELVLGEEDVFVHDRVTIQVKASAKGFERPIQADLQLRDKATGELLAAKNQSMADGFPTTAELVFRPARTGRRVLTVTLVPIENEENTDNNTAEFEINAHDEKIQVLYVEGIPRFEYRYLKNMLLRESTVESSCLLLSATPGFVQEGMRPIRRFPQSIEELRPYDVIILGDVDPRADWLSPVQQAMLSDFVQQQGAGIAFLAGEASMPFRLRQTALEKLLPVKIDPGFMGRYDQTLTDAFSPRLTIEGRQSSLLHLEDDGKEEDDFLAGHVGWYWFARVQGAQPAATVLLTHPTAVVGGQPVPLAVLGRAGAGRTFYLGTDDFWRCRQTIGEASYEAFWLRVLRMLARGRKLGGDCPWRLTTDRRRYELGEAVYVRLIAEEPRATADLKELEVGVSETDRGWIEPLTLKSIGPDAKFLEGSFTPRTAGRFSIIPMLRDAPTGCKKLGANITVTCTDFERLRPEADLEFLRMLASRTGGKFVTSLDDVKELAGGIPDRSVQVADDLEEPLWDKGFVMAGCVLLLFSEWIIRKAIGLT